jgi:hypothetical protein
MVLNWEKEEGAGAKEKRSKGEETVNGPPPPYPQIPILARGSSMQVKDNKHLVQQTMCIYQ